MSYTSTEYTPVLRGPLGEEGEEGHEDMFTGVSTDLTTTMQYITPVAVSVRYTKHPLARDPGLKRHTSPVGDEVLTVTPTTSNVPTKKGCVYMSNIQTGLCIQNRLTYDNSSTCVSITIVCSDGEVEVFVGRYGNSDGGGVSI